LGRDTKDGANGGAVAKKLDIFKIILRAHKRSIEKAIDTSIRTGTSLVVEKNGKIVKIKPKFKYVLVPIEAKKKKPSRKKIVAC
jgi:hypothetical protein